MILLLRAVGWLVHACMIIVCSKSEKAKGKPLGVTSKMAYGKSLFWTEIGRKFKVVGCTDPYPNSRGVLRPGRYILRHETLGAYHLKEIPV